MWEKELDTTGVTAKCIDAAWECFQAHSLGSLKKSLPFLALFWNLNDISVKKAKACGCVGEIQIPSNVQSLEIHMPHNVKAFLFTIYNP